MASENQDLFDELRHAILAADNPKDRAILLIMQRVLARVEEALDNDERIKDVALNGHAERHHLHHDHIETCIQLDCVEVCKSTKALMTPENVKAIAWAAKQHAAEIDAEKTKKTLGQKFAEGFVSQTGTIVASLLAGALGVAYLLK